MAWASGLRTLFSRGSDKRGTAVQARSVGAYSASLPMGTRETDVVIVGGGLSGLSLASKLKKDGYISFELLESRNRFGGRVLSVAADNVDDPTMRYDLGPSWFWPGQRRMEKLLKELGLGWYEQYARGDLVVQDFDGSPKIYRQSMGSMAGSRRITGGTAALTDALVHHLPAEKLHLQHTVKSIEHLEEGCAVVTRCEDAAGNEVAIRSRAVVLALPPQVIVDTISLTPELPSRAAERMKHIPTWMAGHAKVVVVYDTPFWRVQGLSGDGMSQMGPLQEIHDCSPSSGEVGALFGFVGLSATQRLAPGYDLGAEAVKQLAVMFGSSASSPKQVFVKDWVTDVQTATEANKGRGPRGHPAYGPPPELEGLWSGRLIAGSTEVSPSDGGFLEGALGASDRVAKLLESLIKSKAGR